VLLQAPDTVLIERAHGKRIDPETGGDFDFVMCSFSYQHIFISFRTAVTNKVDSLSHAGDPGDAGTLRIAQNCCCCHSAYARYSTLF